MLPPYSERKGAALVLRLVGVCAACLYRKKQAWQQRACLQSSKIKMLQKKNQQLQQCAEEMHAREHEVKHRLLAVQSQIRRGDLTTAEQSVSGWIKEEGRHPLKPYTDNDLIELLLHNVQSRADKLGIRLERRLLGIPASLNINDQDLSILLMNLLDNALKACAAMPDGADRWIKLELRYFQGALAITVKNPYSNYATEHQDLYASRKAGRRKHGYGLENIRRVVRTYGGTVDIRCGTGTFCVDIRINLGMRQ